MLPFSWHIQCKNEENKSMKIKNTISFIKKKEKHSLVNMYKK